MVFYTLDAIARNYLLRKGYPMHFYMQALVYGAACLRELTLDDLKVVNTKIIPVDSNNYAQLPDDYNKFVSIGVEAGQRIRSLVEDNTLNPVPAYDSTFNQTTYGQRQTDPNGNLLYYGYLLPLLWNTVTWNEYGENIGRLFGWGQGAQNDTFVVIPEMNVIKVNENLATTSIVLRYISDGQSANAATQIPADAYDTIIKYIAWQRKENSRHYPEQEKERAEQKYLSSRLILRARLSDLNMDKVIRLFQQNYFAAARS